MEPFKRPDLKYIAAIIAFSAIVLMASGLAFAERAIHEIKTRPNVTVKILLHTPDKESRGTLLLFPGSHGNGHFSEKDGVIKLGSNFLVRSSGLFVEKGFSVAIIDVPSDNAGGMSDSFRKSAEHAADIRAIMEFLKKNGKGPLYFVGTSRGTISAAYLAGEINEPVLKGIVLTSSMGGRMYAGSVNLEKIRVPVLFVHHQNDGCEVSQPGEALAMSKNIKNSPKVNFVEVYGGVSSESAHRGSGKHGGSGPNPCSAGTHHGFIGIEGQVVDVITEWLSGKPVPAELIR
jgi:dienelactone hydrolase